MDKTEDRVVEAMAVARCTARGMISPYGEFAEWTAEGEIAWNVAWHSQRAEALMQYRGYLAMQSVLMDLKPVQAVSETTVPLCDHPRTGPNKYRPIAEFDETAIEIVKRYWGTTMNQCDAETAIYFALCDAAGASKRMRFPSEEAQGHP